jgi:hypothetical protein
MAEISISIQCCLVYHDFSVTIYGVWIGNQNYCALIHLVTTNHYRIHLFFSDCCVFTSRCLVTDPNSVLCFRVHVLTG